MNVNMNMKNESTHGHGFEHRRGHILRTHILGTLTVTELYMDTDMYRTGTWAWAHTRTCAEWLQQVKKIIKFRGILSNYLTGNSTQFRGSFTNSF